jgi:hypothetical protein
MMLRKILKSRRMSLLISSGKKNPNIKEYSIEITKIPHDDKTSFRDRVIYLPRKQEATMITSEMDKITVAWDRAALIRSMINMAVSDCIMSECRPFHVRI